jgi:RNA polymerase sigma-70 factor, ECF subfamily
LPAASFLETVVILEQPVTEVDETGLARAAVTEPQLFDLLYRRYVGDVYRYCFAHTGSHADSEDLTAQIFLAALESLAGYGGRGPFPAWLFAIARRKCADYHRRRYARQDQDLESALPLLRTRGGSIEEQSYLNSVRDCLRQAIEQLTPDRREALRLRFWAGLTVRETAAVMKRGESAVKMLVARAVAELRERCLDA